MSQRTAFITARVYGVVGADNQLQTAVAEEENDEVWFEVLTEEGLYEIFEAEAYHLELWCQDNGFLYYEGIIETDVDLDLVEE